MEIISINLKHINQELFLFFFLIKFFKITKYFTKMKKFLTQINKLKKEISTIKIYNKGRMNYKDLEI